jgi:hypothetical protein
MKNTKDQQNNSYFFEEINKMAKTLARLKKRKGDLHK